MYNDITVRFDVNTLRRNSVKAEEFSERQKNDLVSAYYTIGMVWAEKASNKGMFESVVKCPFEIQNALRAKFSREGFFVSEYNKGFNEEHLTIGGFFINWKCGGPDVEFDVALKNALSE